MSTAAISGSSIFQEIQTFYQTRQADLKQLGNDLKNGNLGGAQQDYQSLTTLGEDGPFANSQPFSSSSWAQDFATIGQDLESGDVADAQAAFTALISNQNTSEAKAVSQTNTITVTTNNPSSIYEQLQAYRQQRQADVAQLGQDLQAGNLTAAQQDFNTLTALGQSGPNKNGQAFERTDRAQDFQSIGQALQSGDLAGAQSAFASLAGTFGKSTTPSFSVGPAPVVPTIVPTISQSASDNLLKSTVLPLSPGTISTGASAPELVINLGGTSGGTSGAIAATGSASPEIVVNLGQGNGSSSTSPEEITINLNTGSSGEQLSINTAQGQNAEQFTINLNPQNNYEVVLNLLNPSATSQTQYSSSNGLSVQA